MSSFGYLVQSELVTDGRGVPVNTDASFAGSFPPAHGSKKIEGEGRKDPLVEPCDVQCELHASFDSPPMCAIRS